MTQAAPRQIMTTYAYHPANNEADLFLPTDIVGRYVTGPRVPLRGNFDALRQSMSLDGVLEPLRIRTNGIFGILADGHSRHRLAIQMGIEELPIQVIPDSLRRVSAQYGHPVLDETLAAWVAENLWRHLDHEVTRHRIGKQTGMAITPNIYLKCVCSCGATWKEGAS